LITVRLRFAQAFTTEGVKVQITREWIDQISDEQGLTKGQQNLLGIWCKEHPYVGKLIPDQVARFLEHCRGYREIPQSVKDFKGWV
jgi:hypothetical protein